MLWFDHLAISAITLDEGVFAVETALGINLSPGGKHVHMGTHNRLLGLDDVYLEVIAPDPDAPVPAWPRWFDLDHFSGAPRLTNWVAACDVLDVEIAQSPAGTGQPTQLSRGNLRWRMAIPSDGKLPYDGCFPALISWQGDLHPTSLLPDMGVRLVHLDIKHPSAVDLGRHMRARLTDDRITFSTGPVAGLQATFSTPHGLRSFGG